MLRGIIGVYTKLESERVREHGGNHGRGACAIKYEITIILCTQREEPRARPLPPERDRSFVMPPLQPNPSK